MNTNETNKQRIKRDENEKYVIIARRHAAHILSLTGMNNTISVSNNEEFKSTLQTIPTTTIIITTTSFKEEIEELKEYKQIITFPESLSTLTDTTDLDTLTQQVLGGE